MINNAKDLEIFELCEKLAELLGDKEAIADLRTLEKRHPEMFVDKKQVSNLIQIVTKEPELIIKNPRPKNEKDFIAVKHLQDTKQKIGDIGIRNDDGTNTIFHANISSNRNFKRLAKKEQVVTGEAVHSLHTSRPAELGGNNQKLSGANAHSATTKKIISQENKSKAYFQEKLKNFNHIASKNKELEK
ncbi:hypothetical protein L8T94_06355 [Campylobacter lari]|nr:hypothetical protein [Campylobacter lari]